MSVAVSYNFDLSEHSTLRIGGTGKVLYTVTDPEHDLKEVFQDIQKQKISWMIIGEGSNSVFSDGLHEMAFIQFKKEFIPCKGIYTEVVKEERESMIIYGYAGMLWDYFVQETMELGLTGLEALSAIPGTIGAAPVQNIGAYGTQFSDRCKSVRVFNTKTLEIEELSKESCEFSYRSSIFKTEKKYVILGVTLFLFKTTDHPDVPDYKDVREYFEKRELIHPSSEYIRKAIVEIRWGKLPKPSELPNCGSFFKNAEISRTDADTLLKKYPEMPNHPPSTSSFPFAKAMKKNEKGGLYKIPTAWLIEQVGLKGYRIGDVGIYDKHALVVVNYGKGTYTELERLIQLVQEKVDEKFDIIVEPEVNIIKSNHPLSPSF